MQGSWARNDMSATCAPRGNGLSLEQVGNGQPLAISRPNAMKVFEDQGRFTIEIASVRTWDHLSVDVCALLIWTFLAFEVARTAPPPQLLQNYVISAAAFLFLTTLALLALARLAWRLWGLEEIVVRETVLTVVRRLGLFGWSRSYRLSAVRDLHVTSQAARRILWPWQSFRVIRGSLAFNYQGKTCRMADRLDQLEAKALLKRFREWLPAANWTPVLGLQ